MRFPGWSSSSIAVLLSAGAAATAALPVVAQGRRVDAAVPFDIPALPLDEALARYFRLTGVQLLYEGSLTAGYRSAAVRGTYAPRDALRLLLRGTGLVVRYSGATSAIITRPDGAPDTPLVPLGRVVVRDRIVTGIAPGVRLAYYQELKDQLEARLRDDRRAGRSAFAVVMALSVGAEGRIAAVRVVRGSGDERLDRMLVDILADAVVPPPPAGLEQPLAISLRGSRR